MTENAPRPLVQQYPSMLILAEIDFSYRLLVGPYAAIDR